MKPISPGQALTIGAKLYTKERNQKHLEEWCKANLNGEQAHKILEVIWKLKYDLAKNNPEEFTRVQNWGREQVKALGYVESPVNKSL